MRRARSRAATGRGRRPAIALGLALALAGLTLAACVQTAMLPADTNIDHWRTTGGDRLTDAEFAALTQSCAPRVHEAAVDPWAPVGGPQTDNPAYHPGGESLLGAPPTGIARLGAPVAVATTESRQALPQPLEECLESKGLVHSP